MNKDELLSSIRSERAILDALVASLDPAAMTEPTLEGGRSVKDVLAHITVWEQLCLSRLAPGEQDEQSEEPQAGFSEADMHRFNEAVFVANRDRPLAAVQDKSRRSYAAILTGVERLDAASLDAPVRFGATAGSPTLQSIREDTDQHYRVHIDQIEAWRVGADA